MRWYMSHPLLFSMPIIVCFIIHMLVSAGFIVERKKGFIRFSLYVFSAWFMLGYLLLFNQWYTQASTNISFFPQEATLIYKDQYGTQQIKGEEIKGVVVEGSQQYPKCVWLISDNQALYLAGNMNKLENFLPSLQKALQFEKAIFLGEGRYFIPQIGASIDRDEIIKIIEGKDVFLNGDMRKHLILLALMPLVFYFLGISAWMGRYKYFLLLFFIYIVPIALLSVFFKPFLTVLIFSVVYFFYLVYLSAMCIK